jgi:hypothetical protein
MAEQTAHLMAMKQKRGRRGQGPIVPFEVTSIMT